MRDATLKQRLQYSASLWILWIMKGDKDTSVVTLNKTDYTEKLENMVKEGIGKGRYCSEGNSEKNPSLITQQNIYFH